MIRNAPHAPSPWKGEIRETNAQTLRYTVRDKQGDLIAVVNELNHHSNANLALISKAPELLDELKNALAVIELESSHLTAFITRARILILEAENKFL